MDKKDYINPHQGDTILDVNKHLKQLNKAYLDQMLLLKRIGDAVSLLEDRVNRLEPKYARMDTNR